VISAERRQEIALLVFYVLALSVGKNQMCNLCGWLSFFSTIFFRSGLVANGLNMLRAAFCNDYFSGYYNVYLMY